MNLVFYIIYCNEERKNFMEKQMSDLKISYPIIYFKAFTPENSQDWVIKDDKINQNEKLQCCCRSHIEILKDFNTREEEFLLILEDDVCLLKKNFESKLRKIMEIYKNNFENIDYISLGYIPTYLNLEPINSGFKFYKKQEMIYYDLSTLKTTIWGTQVQLFHKEKSKKIIQIIDNKSGTELLNSVINYSNKYGYKQDKHIYLSPDSILPFIFNQGIIESHLAIEKNFGCDTSIHIKNEMQDRKNSWVIGHNEEMYTITDFYSYE